MTKIGPRNRRRERKNSFFFSFSLFSCLSLSLFSLLFFLSFPLFNPTPLPSITVLIFFFFFCERRDSEMCFMAWSACKSTSNSVVLSHFKKWRFFDLTGSLSVSLFTCSYCLCFVLLPFLWTRQDL